jgi:hypothetical protein
VLKMETLSHPTASMRLSGRTNPIRAPRRFPVEGGRLVGYWPIERSLCPTSRQVIIPEAVPLTSLVIFFSVSSTQFHPTPLRKDNCEKKIHESHDFRTFLLPFRSPFPSLNQIPLKISWTLSDYFVYFFVAPNFKIERVPVLN